MANIFQSLFKRRNKDYKYAQMLNGYAPVFSQFGQNIYSSDVVQMCIDVIATECSKLLPRHILTKSDGIQQNPKGGIYYLLKFGPNELMTTKDFIEKVIWQLYLNYNCFIYPTYNIKVDGSREYTGFYPLSPTTATFMQDEKKNLFVKMNFANGEETTLPYPDLIHLRKKFSINEVMGGGLDGQPDNKALLKVLEINDTALQGIEKGVKSSMQIRGVLNIKTMLDDDKQKAERDKFEKAIKDNESGIMTVDLKSDYMPIKVNPKLIDKNTLDFLQDKILNWYGVSLPIMSGDYSDEQYQAFYEKTLNPLVIMLGQAFSKVLFSRRELECGNEIVFYQQDLMYLSTKLKLDLMKTAGEQGLFTDNQKLALLGYPPLSDGSGTKRTVSLNYIDVNLVNDYQMKNAGGKEKENGKEK